MPVETRDAFPAMPAGVGPILARAAAADARGDARLSAAISDFFLNEHDRLDDRTRSAMTLRVSATLRAVEATIAGHAGVAPPPGGGAIARLTGSGLLRDADLMEEWLGQVRQDLLGASLAANCPPDVEPNLIGRLLHCGDDRVEAAARAYLVAEGQGDATTLPADLHARVAWWVAAALRERRAQAPASRMARDTALADAAEHCIAAHRDDIRIDAAAARLSRSIAAQPDELPVLLIDALNEGRPALFVAALADAAEVDFAEARAILLDPDGDRLWLTLRGEGFDRAGIARIGLALCEADPRRDLEAFVDVLDDIVAIAPDAARRALRPMLLHRDFRRASRALSRAGE